jgi:HEAT repeat protein
LKVVGILIWSCLLSTAPAVLAQDGTTSQPVSPVSELTTGIAGNSAAIAKAATDHRSVKELAEALKSDDREARSEAVVALGQSKDSHAVKALIASLKDRDPYVRAYAGMALIRIGTPAVPPLINAMKENDLYVSALSALALSSMKDPRAHNALMKAMQEHNSKAIFGTHTFFVKLGVPGSESALIEALNKFPSQEMAEEFLNSGNPALVMAAKDWAQKYKRTLKPALNSALVHWGSAQETPVQTASNPVQSAQ